MLLFQFPVLREPVLQQRRADEGVHSARGAGPGESPRVRRPRDHQLQGVHNRLEGRLSS